MVTQQISKYQLDVLKGLGLPEVKENNQWLVLHVRGDGIRAPVSWNAKVYTDSAGSMKVVTTDMAALLALLGGGSQVQALQVPPSAPGASRVISIDDSGWGFPLGGVLFGVHDSLTGKILTTEVRVEFFQSPRFERKEYLEQAAVQVAPLLNDLGAADEAGVVCKICTGYVNNGIDLMLRKHLYQGGGCRVVREAIGEPLQSALEKAHAEYIQKLTGGASLYYDPKELTGSAIRRAYSDAMRWIREHNAWDIAKTGWSSMKAHR